MDLKINIRAVQLSIMCFTNDDNKVILIPAMETISMAVRLREMKAEIKRRKIFLS